MRIGIDVGGTNTDAVLMDGAEILAKTKRSTTADVTSGIVAAIESVLADSGTPQSAIGAVMIGTTHFTNAVIEGRELAPTAILRLGLPATQAVEPFEDWPSALLKSIGAQGRMVHGGNEFDGRPLSPLDPHELNGVIDELVAAGIRSVAIAGVFSPITPDGEREVAEIIRKRAPEMTVTLSHEIARLGLLERENAAAINASLLPLAERTIGSFGRSLAELSITAPLYLTQNDGTLMSAETARLYPVLTFASGPTNSMRGAAFLSGIRDALVLDVGGTTSDIGALTGGFPRTAAIGAAFAGVHTGFRMPDLISFGLGGGSLVRGDEPVIGPDSVGHRITERALVFGGDTLTATDLAVRAGRASVGDASLVAGLDMELAGRGVEWMQATTEAMLDQMKLRREPEPVIVVGGGSILIPDALLGASSVIRPDHFEVANAVGAAIAQVSGEVDTVVALDGSRDELLAEAKRVAVERAEANGAVRGTIEVVEQEDIPVPYMERSMIRLRVKVIGDLDTALVSP